MSDLIDRQAAIDAYGDWYVEEGTEDGFIGTVKQLLEGFPSAQLSTNLAEVGTDVPERNVGDKDTISRQAAIRWVKTECNPYGKPTLDFESGKKVIDHLEQMPSAQPEQHTCVNCGRTVNNGGWYADGRTRCPIEEHYALPKDGYCHLWEKRNVTDDDYPERREE